MKKILTITLDSDRGSIVTEWGDGVTANDVIAMCEYAEGEAQYELDLNYSISQIKPFPRI